jgi:hypothetical protein
MSRKHLSIQENSYTILHKKRGKKKKQDHIEQIIFRKRGCYEKARGINSYIVSSRSVVERVLLCPPDITDCPDLLDIDTSCLDLHSLRRSIPPLLTLYEKRYIVLRR